MLSIIKALFSGFLLWLGFAPAELWIAPFIALGLLFHCLVHRSVRQRISLSFLSGFTFFLLLLHWSSTYVGAVPWLILVFGQATIFSLLGILPLRSNALGALTFASSFTLIELIRMKFPFGGFGWGRIGFTQIEALSGLYPLIGVTGVTVLVALSSLVFVNVQARLIFVGILLLAFFIPHLENHPISTLRVAAIQGGVDNLGLDFNNRALSVLKRHISATKSVTNVDLIIWPENASDVDPMRNSIAKSAITKLINEKQIPLLLGAVENSKIGPVNSSLYYNSGGVVTSRYVKQDLAPFGEYIPLRNVAESISAFARNVRDFQPGNSWIKHSVIGVPFQSIICFEILDDDHVRAGSIGTGFLVAQTNNATFGMSSEAAQQLQITRARAAELGRDIAVVSTTGFTAHIGSHGEIRKEAPQFETTVLRMVVKAVDPQQQTPASRIPSGAWFGFLGCLLAATTWLNRR
jgi:apolipoprotein N-acyltransferase